MNKILVLTAAILTIVAVPSLHGAVLIQEGFNGFDTGTRPAGWSFIGCDANSDTYTSSAYVGIAAPSVKFDNTGDQIVTTTFSSPVTLSFWLRGVSTDSASSFLIEEYGGTSWSTVTNLTELPTSGTNFSGLDLNPSTSQLRFTYTKSTGNLAFDDVEVDSPATTTTVATTTTTTTTAGTTTGGTTTTGATTTATTTVGTTTTASGCGEVYEGFDDFDSGTRPAGWSFIGCDANSDTYTSSAYVGIAAPSIKLDNTGDQIVSAAFGTCSYELSFWLRGVSTDDVSALLVEEFYSSGWNLMTTIFSLPTSGTVMDGFQLNPSTSQLRFTYAKSAGNMAFDDFTLIPPPTPSPSVSPTPSAPASPTPTAPPSATPTLTPEGYKTPTPPPTPPPTAPPTPSAPPTATPTATVPCGPSGPDDLLVLGASDYDGDGMSDPAVFRSTEALWIVRGVTRVYFGVAGDRPVPADYDGDGRTDFAFWRGGLWSIRSLSRFYFGTATDRPVPGDFDGDGQTEPAFYRATNGLWKIKGITSLYASNQPGDFSVPARYTAETRDLPGIFRPSAGLWIVPGLTRIYFGQEGDWPVPGDYDGSGVESVAFFRPSNGLWKVRWITRFYQGKCLDLPVPADYTGDGVTLPGTFKPANARWNIDQGGSVFWFGLPDDIPISR